MASGAILPKIGARIEDIAAVWRAKSTLLGFNVLITVRIRPVEAASRTLMNDHEGSHPGLRFDSSLEGAVS